MATPKLLSSHLVLTYSHGGALHAAHSSQFTCWFNVFTWRWRHRATVLCATASQVNLTPFKLNVLSLQTFAPFVRTAVRPFVKLHWPNVGIQTWNLLIENNNSKWSKYFGKSPHRRRSSIGFVGERQVTWKWNISWLVTFALTFLPKSYQYRFTIVKVVASHLCEFLETQLRGPRKNSCRCVE